MFVTNLLLKLLVFIYNTINLELSQNFFLFKEN